MTTMVAAYSSDDDAPSTKRQRSSVSPRSFVTWNCNGLLSRCKGNQSDLQRLVEKTKTPDVIFLQEVRCKATSPTRRDKPCREDETAFQHLFQGGPFQTYEAFWSLADTRYSGTCTLMHKRLGLRGEHDDMAAFSTTSAIDLLLKKYNLTRADVGIAETTTAVTKTACSIQSFFGSSSTTPPHDDQGRFQFFSLEDIDIIHTYVPNHGTKPESFARRQEWDNDMLQFLKNRQTLLEKANRGQRQLLWAGDMNVARDYRDGTHWSESNGMIQEWWTNESKCFVRPSSENREACHRGMPSFTPAERTRFEAMLKQGQLMDVWRELHPHGSTSHEHLSKWERPDWTWRGHPGKNKKAKYEGTGQRLDYFLTANIPMNQVEECEILGHGTNREGLFCGSDHCAVTLQLSM